MTISTGSRAEPLVDGLLTWLSKLSRMSVSMCPELNQAEARELADLLVELQERVYSEYERGYDDCYGQFVSQDDGR